MTTSAFLRCSLVATSLVLFGAPARAVCTITEPGPTGALPSPEARRDGQRFEFEASADCAVLEFTAGAFSTTPVAGPYGPRTYHVNLHHSLPDLVDESDTTFEWTVRGWTTAGVLTEVTTTNELDFDHDRWTRSDGDSGACDYDADRHPGVSETCDGVDQDCDGVVDDVALVWVRDSDDDGYGDDSDTLVASCDGVSGYVAIGGDCNDAEAAIHPTAPEGCDDVDNNCDGVVSCTLSVSDADAEYSGGGAALAGAGDVDGDGYDDILVSRPYNRSGAPGTTYLVLGGSVPASMPLTAADAQYVGERKNDVAGCSVAGAGDVDGDGYDDLLIGAFSNDDGGGQAGAAYVVLGGSSPTSMSLSSADAEYTGTVHDYAGTSVASAGDVDGDGYDDLLVGAPWAGDGGAAYLVLGDAAPASASLPFADAVYSSEGSGDYAGDSVAGAGDVDGDGYDDILVGAPWSNGGGSGAGVAYLVRGGPSLASASLSDADALYTSGGCCELAGGAVAGAQDVDGDGYNDMLVGAKFKSHGGHQYVGSAYLVLGSDSPVSTPLSEAAAEYIGEAGEDWAGSAVSAAGDVNLDGYGDMLVGAYGNDESGDRRGAAYLILGDASPASTLLSAANLKYTGTRQGAGYSVGAAGDMNGDGYDEVLVGDGFSAYLMLGGGL